jgi:hypothetical protein
VGANAPESDQDRDRRLTNHQCGDIGRVWLELHESPSHDGESEACGHSDDPKEQVAGVARQRRG